MICKPIRPLFPGIKWVKIECKANICSTYLHKFDRWSFSVVCSPWRPLTDCRSDVNISSELTYFKLTRTYFHLFSHQLSEFKTCNIHSCLCVSVIDSVCNHISSARFHQTKTSCLQQRGLKNFTLLPALLLYIINVVISCWTYEQYCLFSGAPHRSEPLPLAACIRSATDSSLHISSSIMQLWNKTHAI